MSQWCLRGDTSCSSTVLQCGGTDPPPISHWQAPTAAATRQPTVLTAPVMDQLASWVTDKVTKQLQPLLSNLSSTAHQAQSPPSTSSQAPAV